MRYNQKQQSKTETSFCYINYILESGNLLLLMQAYVITAD